MKSSCSSLTKQEMDAVLQLIQLSGGTGDDVRILWMDLAGGTAAAEASSSISSSGSINEEEMMDDEPLPRINHRFGSLVDIYGKTINNRSKNKKRARF